METREAFLCSTSPDNTPDLLKIVTIRSLLAAPILDGAETLGVVGVMSSERDWFGEKDIGRIQLLAALIAFLSSRQRKTSANAEAAVRLGRALSDILVELLLTQDELAYHGGFQDAACLNGKRAMGAFPWPFIQMVRCPRISLRRARATGSVLDVTPQLLELLKNNPEELINLSPERFEHVVAERIERMGYDVQLTGRSNRRDGGIDLIAVPKLRTVGSILMAAQIKHHQGETRLDASMSIGCLRGRIHSLRRAVGHQYKFQQRRTVVG